MARATNKQNSVNPIKPVGLGSFVVKTYPMTRYIDYTEADWRMYSDQLINNGMAQGWDTMVTWMLASSPFVQTLIERRLNPILSARYVLMDENGNVDEALTEQIDKGWFRKWIEAASMAIFQGYSGGVFQPQNNKIERYPISVIDPFNRALKHTPFDLNGHERFDDYSNLFYVEYSSQHQTMLGLFQPLLKEYVGIAITLRNWLASGTRLAFPLTQVGYNGAGVELQDYIAPDGTIQQKKVNPNQETAREIAANIDPTVAITTPFSVDDGKQVYSIEVKQTEHHSTSDAYKTYYDYIDQAEIRMINLVLGSQLTIKEGNSRSLGEVHERVAKTYAERDVKWMVEVLNNVLKPKLNIPDNRWFSDDSASTMSMDEAQKMSDIVNQNGKQLTQEFFTQIGLPENFYEDKSGISLPPVAIKEEAEIETKEEKNFVRKALDFLTARSRQTPQEPEGIIYLRAPKIKEEVAKEDVDLPAGSHAHVSDAFVRKLYETEQPQPVFIDLEQYKYYADTFKAPLFGNNPLVKLSAKGNGSIPDDLVPRYMANIFQFSAAKNVAEQAAVNDAIARSLFNDKGQKVSFSQFKKAVNKIVSTFREDWLKTEYRTASMTAIMANQWGSLWAQRDSLPYWRYRTQEDNKVRDEHARLNGRVFRIDDPNAQRLFPPNGWNCRCFYEGVSEYDRQKNGWQVAPNEDIQDLLSQDVEKGFTYNAGINGIMPNKDSSYFDVLPSINRLSFDKYRLDSVNKMMETAPKVDVYQGTVSDIAKMLKRAPVQNGNILVHNSILRMGFALTLSLRSRLEVAGGKGVNLLGETISNPDEMWMQWMDENNQTKTKGVMLRIASNVVYAVEFEDNVITDAYVVRNSLQADMLRRGLLMVR